MRNITGKTFVTAIAIALTPALLAGCNAADSAAAAPSTGSGAPSAGATRPVVAAPSASKPAAKPEPGSVDGVFYYYEYADNGTRLVRLAGAGVKTVLRGSGAWTAEVSPDGRRIAYVTDDGDLKVGDANGSRMRTLRSGVVSAGFGPTWSGDGASVVIATGVAPENRIGTFRVADKRFTALPRPIDGIHHRLTGDGSRIFWSDGRCKILSARPDGSDKRTVPVLGLDTDSSQNPKRLRACDIVSLNADGSRMTVDLHKGNQTDGDIAGSIAANAVIDTATGKPVRLPVSGEIDQVLFEPDGTLIVRSTAKGKGTITHLSAGLEVIGTRAEPAAVAGMTLTDVALAG